MSRRLSSSSPRTPSSSSAPYHRRTPGQPKSTRQQFSACGACRMRRVRCDLKDSYMTSANGIQHPSCSNCRERNIRCVDEFAEVKAVKLLRRGRRLQQVEARYGKVTEDIVAIPSSAEEPASSTFSPATTHSCIPQMQLPFLTSSFFRRFCVQHPIIEPGEFASRYIAHTNGNAPLNIEGEILAMLFVTWAASFGIDAFGNEEAEDGTSDSHGTPHLAVDGGDNLSNPKRHARSLRSDAMIREILTLVDHHGLLRRPSWDGVKVLLLLLPLTHGIQTPLEHLATYQATLSQVHALCNLPDSPSIDSGLGPYCDILIRARIFWYAHVHEGITSGLNGSRLVLDDGDLAAFQSTLPPQYCASASHSITSPVDPARSSPRASPPLSPTFPFVTPLEPSHPRASLAYMVTTQYLSLALAVSKACRAIHFTLTGPRASRGTASCAALYEAVSKIWDQLERCWDNFEALRRNPPGVGVAGGDLIRGEDVERFVSGWQIFIFGCLNTIREALYKHTEDSSNQVDTAGLYLSAIGQCQKFLPRVIEMLQRHLKVPSSFFAYDTGLIRDGCFFAGLLLAQSDKHDLGTVGIRCNVEWKDGVEACLQALGEARWVCSRSHEQERTLRAEREARIHRDAGHQQVPQSPAPLPIKQSPGHSPCLNDDAPLPCSPLNSQSRVLSLVAAGGQVRPHLSPLAVSFPHDDSGPETVLTDDGSGGWEPYTPPSTSESLTGTVATHRSLSPSPHQSTIEPIHGIMRSKSLMFGDDSDPFSFAIKTSPDSRNSMASGAQARWTPFSLDPRVILTTSDAVMGCDDGFSSLGSNRLSYFA